MALFQKSVLKSQLEKLDEDLIQQSWGTYKSYFLDASKQKIIFEKKEEELQYEFLLQLFDKCLGYDIGVGSQNLFVEQKNQTDSKKADGAIKIKGEIVCVIELKSTKTKNLKDVEKQAFGYKVSHPNCKYVVTSNFNKLRFYIDNTTDFEEFDLFNLTNDRFKLLWLCLSYDSISLNKPLNINKESLVNEEKITKQLYKDYSEFRLNLFADLKENNPQVKSEVLLQKTQKLLDRILFILFSEDRGLLPSNSITEIINYWDNKKEFGDDETLYDTYVTYFNVINKGRPQRGNKEAIYAYNGGLFIDDEVLENLVISDDLLLEYSKKLTAYDFESDISVNILGHIFEHSLSEIEEIQSQIEGKELDKSKSKRKKDGVFYTPQYITKYIVENTVGKLCEEKKIELKINEGEYLKGRKGRPKKKLQSLIDLLSSYRNWLLQITICDPACGSGAFLNQALEFLITEHQYIDELQSSLLEEPIPFSEIESSILENNLYGVDINKESVEIAKLSLWLRTAQKGRKLTSLNNNIKCGNSLIDDPKIAGDKSFNWENEFPEVFTKGGFDVVIGNPPYGAKLPKKDLNFIVEKYSTGGMTKTLSDTYIAFYIISSELLLKKNGVLSFISPNTWRLISSGKEFRNFMFRENSCVFKIVQHLEKVFTDATVDCDTVFIKKSGAKPNDVNLIIREGELDLLNHHIDHSLFKTQEFYNLNLTDKHYQLSDKIKSRGKLVSELFVIKNGIKPYEKGKGKPPQTSEIMKEKPFTSDVKISDKSLPLIGGSLFNRYQLFWNENSWVEYGEWLAAPRDFSIFEANEKIIFRQTSDKIIGVKIGQGYIMRNNTHILLPEDKRINLNYALGVLNSKLTDFFYWTLNPEKGEAMAEVKAFHLGMLILPIPNNDIQNFISEKVEVLLKRNTNKTKLNHKFTKYLQSQFSIEKLPKKLQNWHELEFGDFIKELNKVIKKAGGEKLSKMDEMEWMEVFETNKSEAQTLKAEIDKTDTEIDTMVYELYGLTKEEIEIIENS